MSSHVPPQNTEAEQSLLGSLLVTDGGAMSSLRAFRLLPEDFYFEKHTLIFAAIEALLSEGKPSGEIAVVQHLKDRAELESAGGQHYVSELAAKVPAIGNARHYAEIVKQCARRRQLLEAGQQLQEAALNPSLGLDEALEDAQEAVIGSERWRAGGPRLARHGVEEVIDHQERLANSESEIDAVRTGFADLDELLHYLEPGTVVVIAARPSLGKSALAGNIAEHVALDQGKAVLFQSLEMSEKELLERMLASQASVPLSSFKRGRIAKSAWPKIMRACNRFEQAPLYIDDDGGLTSVEIAIRARALQRQLEHEGGLSLMILDYLQLIRASNPRHSEFEKVTDASINLKALAKDLRIPIIVVSQLSRAPENRPDHRPQLSDLRQSGQIEQDADVVMFIYREDYYDKESEATGVAEISIAKNRNGPSGTCELTFIDRFAAFRNHAPDQAEEAIAA